MLVVVLVLESKSPYLQPYRFGIQMNGDLLYFHLRKQDYEGEENQPRNAMVVGQLDRRDKKKKKKKLQQVCLAMAFHI